VNYWLHPEVETELGDAAVYYANHASQLIAEAFLVGYERVRDVLIKNQQMKSSRKRARSMTPLHGYARGLVLHLEVR
jgi:hypothetical protein